MKKILLLTAFLFAFPGMSAHTMAAPPVGVGQVPITDFPFVIPCNGEDVLINGTIQVIYKTHVDKKGRPHLSFRLQFVNVEAIGSYGNVYRLVGNTQVQLPAPLGDPWTTIFLPAEGDGPVILRHHISNRFIPVGGSDADLYKFDIRVNVTVNSNGDLVVDTGDREGEASCL